MAIIVRANKESSELGGHIASFESAATLYDIGFNHFWHAPSEGHGGDLVYVQGHASPGIYARAYLEGASPSSNCSIPAGSRRQGHPVVPASLADAGLLAVPDGVDGLGPLMAIYQARFMNYLEDRGIADRGRKVWAFLGDGEMDEPESLGAISLPGARSSTTWSSSSTATCSGSTGRCAATARSSRSSRAPSAAPAGT